MTPEIKKPPKFAVEEVSPSLLSYFLQKQEASLKFSSNSSYAAIFTSLRTFTSIHQEKLLVGFVTRTLDHFPNPQRFGRFLAKINNIRWNKPRAEPNVENLQQLSDDFYQRLGLRTLPLRIIRGDWCEVWEAVKQSEWSEIWGKVLNFVGTTREEAQSPTRNLALNTGWGAVRQTVHDSVLETGAGPKMAEDIARHTALAASWAAVWITVKDSTMLTRRSKRTNPLEMLFDEVYDKGSYFIGPVNGESVIFVPEIKKAA